MSSRCSYMSRRQLRLRNECQHHRARRWGDTNNEEHGESRADGSERTQLLDRAARRPSPGREVERRVVLTKRQELATQRCRCRRSAARGGKPQTKREEGDCFEVERETHATPRRGCVLVLGLHLMSVLSLARGDVGKRTRRCGWGYRGGYIVSRKRPRKTFRCERATYKETNGVTWHVGITLTGFSEIDPSSA